MNPVYTYTVLLTIIITVVLNNIPNNSNIPNRIIVPLISALLVKYIIGDWDTGYVFTYMDIFYWVVIIVISNYITKVLHHQ